VDFLCGVALSGTTNEANINAQGDKSRTSRLAIASLVLGIAWILLGPLTAIPGLILGIIAIVKIRRSRGLLKGRPFAIAGIITSAIPIVLIGMFILWFAYRLSSGMKLSARKPEAILKDGRLAELPVSATDIKAEGWNGIFTGECYLVFCATPEDIEKFIAESPSIKDTEPEIFSSEKMYLPYCEPNDFTYDADLEAYFEHKYFFPRKSQPEWYNIAIRLKGRRYEIPAFKHHNWGSVIINDETNTVYINVIWS
jgi:hypothetical protein